MTFVRDVPRATSRIGGGRSGGQNVVVELFHAICRMEASAAKDFSVLKVATWNVNSIAIRLERLLAFLDRVAPDIVCLQELKCVDDKFPFAALEAKGYFAEVWGQKSYNGVAILTREKANEVRRGFDDGVDDAQARFISCKVYDTTVMSAYVPNGQSVGTDKYFYKLNWLARLGRYLDMHHRPKDALILAGDFNVAPEDKDVHDPAAWKEKILCSTRERLALQATTMDLLQDAYRQLHPSETQFTWWDYRMLAFPKNLGLRIDLVYVSSPLTTRLQGCHVERDERKGDKPSDHAPVIVTLA